MAGRGHLRLAPFGALLSRMVPGGIAAGGAPPALVRGRLRGPADRTRAGPRGGRAEFAGPAQPGRPEPQRGRDGPAGRLGRDAPGDEPADHGGAGGDSPRRVAGPGDSRSPHRPRGGGPAHLAALGALSPGAGGADRRIARPLWRRDPDRHAFDAPGRAGAPAPPHPDRRPRPQRRLLLVRTLEDLLVRFTEICLRRNSPFSGAYITAAYGRPARNVHVVQLELDRSLYMDERLIEPRADFDVFAARFARIVARLARLRPDACGPAIAAE
ncbi:hypothetical protein DPM13_08220 [Paracoccus mutanolyticus]|uniref:Uncharacterized protein n=1 Tax=Paracoccus mutanolyticus TaxID=1499308 RepID=A0ABM6WUQ4_9RHOB|nr:hypothetical protein DPM13_08220 [Paracoccus mutanolyticus]